MCFVKYSISNLTNSLIVKCLAFLNLLFPLSTFRFSNERRLKVERGKGLFQTVTYQNCYVTSCLLIIPQTMPFCSAWKTSRYYNICLQYFQWLLCSIFTVKCVHKPPWVSLKRPPPLLSFWYLPNMFSKWSEFHCSITDFTKALTHLVNSLSKHLQKKEQIRKPNRGVG